VIATDMPGGGPGPLGPDLAIVRRALVVEDDAFARTLLATLLRASGFEVEECATAREAIDRFDEVDPDVLVVDIQLAQPPNGAQLAQGLRARAPYLGVVAVSQYPSPDAANAGGGLPPGSAFVHKGRIDSPGVLLEAIESVLDDAAAPLLVAALPDGSPLAGCSARQVGLLRMIALGWTNERIAVEAGVGQRAVEQAIHRLYARLGLAGDEGTNLRVRAARLYVSAFGDPEDEA
jgi:DNA-binding NarL/FixJ family response regulator